MSAPEFPQWGSLPSHPKDAQFRLWARNKYGINFVIPFIEDKLGTLEPIDEGEFLKLEKMRFSLPRIFKAPKIQGRWNELSLIRKSNTAKRHIAVFMFGHTGDLIDSLETLGMDEFHVDWNGYKVTWKVEKIEDQ